MAMYRKSTIEIKLKCQVRTTKRLTTRVCYGADTTLFKKRFPILILKTPLGDTLDGSLLKCPEGRAWGWTFSTCCKERPQLLCYLHLIYYLCIEHCLTLRGTSCR